MCTDAILIMILLVEVHKVSALLYHQVIYKGKLLNEINKDLNILKRWTEYYGPILNTF